MNGSIAIRLYMTTVRVLLIAGHSLLRQSLREMFMLEASAIEVVGEAGVGCEGIAAARQLLPDVVVMNVRLPDMSGLEGARLLSQELPDTRVVLLGQEDGEEYQREALRHGASAYLPYWAPIGEILVAVKAAASNKPASQEKGWGPAPPN